MHTDSDVLTIVVTCNSTNKSCQLQQCIQKLSFAIVAYERCHLLLLHTKAIAALTQFCDFSSSKGIFTFKDKDIRHHINKSPFQGSLNLYFGFHELEQYIF